MSATKSTVAAPPPGAYEGEFITSCDPALFRFDETWAVVVTGVSWNKCGHMLVNFGGVGGTYFQVAEFHNYPRYMNEEGYRRYMSENGKSEIRRVRVLVPNTQLALAKLEQLLSEKWTWGGLPHNCVAFTETVFQAGGATNDDGTPWGLYSNCPVELDSPPPGAEWYWQLQQDILHLYGVSY